jgi:hypothetical protein
VEVRGASGNQSVVAVIPADRSVVGAIAYRDVQTLIDCIAEGNEYNAKIVERSTTSVKVQIARK